MELAKAPNQRARFGVFELDLRSGELRKNGAKVSLQEQPFQILQLLLENPGEVVTRDELRGRIWAADTFVAFDQGLYSAMTKLREALGDSAENPRFVQTLPRRGYRFIAPVERIPESLEPQTSVADPALEGRKELSEARKKRTPWHFRSMVSAHKAWIMATTLLAILAAAASVVAWRATRPVLHPLMRVSVDLGPDAMVGLNMTVSISPDGTRIVYPARGPEGSQVLATRLLDQSQGTLLAGTENATDPFFSPDGQWVGFFAAAQLKKIPVQGGVAVTLCAAPTEDGASWGEDGTIIASLSLDDGLSRVPSSGGFPQPVTRPARGEASHRWPQILPGGRAVLFTSSASSFGSEDGTINVVELQTGMTKTLLRGGYFGRYLPGGYLVYVHQGVLFGVGFDADRIEIRGTPSPLLEDVAGNGIRGGGQFDFSHNGTFVYLAGKGLRPRWPVVWLDGSGNTKPLVATPGAYDALHLSPDGERLALVNGGDLFVYNLRNDAMTRLTFTGQATEPVWSPDGLHIAFQSLSSSGPIVSWKRADGAGETRPLLESGNKPIPYSFSPDGRRLAYLDLGSDTGYDIWMLPLDLGDPDHPKPGKPELFLRTPFNETVPLFSPDGRWVAYRSSESGTNEIYVRPFPAEPSGSGPKWQISTGGAWYPIWSNNGHEMFYETLDNRIMAVDYTVKGESFFPGKPRPWSGRQILHPLLVNLSLAPDGKRFAVFPMPEPIEGDTGSGHVTFLLNFFDELRRHLPSGK